MTNTIDYKDFVGIMAANLVKKKESDDLETDEEFQSIVAVVFRNAVARYMKDSKLYKMELPVDVYAGVNRYDIIPPKGFMVLETIQLLESEIKIPKHRFDTKSVYLNCCPNQDVDKAFYVEVALGTKRINGACEFDEDFIERNYDAIETLMFHYMANMTARTWKAKTSASVYERQYRRLVQSNLYDESVGGSQLKVKLSRITDRASC